MGVLHSSRITSFGMPKALLLPSAKKKYKALAVEKELDIFFEVGQVKKGSEIYNKIVQMNALDMELYWFAIDLHKAQRASLPWKKRTHRQKSKTENFWILDKLYKIMHISMKTNIIYKVSRDTF